jgi:hypothetical protein
MTDTKSSKNNELNFKSQTTEFKNKNVLYICSFTTTGHCDTYFSDFNRLSEVYTYIHTRYLNKSNGCKRRSIKLTKIEGNLCSILQTSEYSNFTSYKLYNIYTKDRDTLDVAVEMFDRTQF